MEGWIKVEKNNNLNSILGKLIFLIFRLFIFMKSKLQIRKHFSSLTLQLNRANSKNEEKQKLKIQLKFKIQ